MKRKDIKEIYREIRLEDPYWADNPDGGLETAYNMGFNDALERQRYCFEKDNDGHTYLIPFDMKDKFHGLLYGEDEDTFIKEFDHMRINMHFSNYSFIDPRKE